MTTSHVEGFSEGLSPAPAHLASAQVASEATRRLVRRYVERRVARSDVDDVVQATLCDALASGRAPAPAEDFRRWVLGIARFKVVDAHRAAARSRGEEAADLAAPTAAAAPVEALSLLRWAERQLPRGTESTLGWMMREAEGDKLEAIAADERLPAERVRQRVSRLRRWMRGRWLAEMALIALVAVAAASVLRGRQQAILPEMGTPDVPIDRALGGSWRLVDFMPTVPLSAGRQALLDRVAPDLEAIFDGRELRVVAKRAGFERTFTAAAHDGRVEGMDGARGTRISGSYAWVGDELVVNVPSGPWAGVARLRKVR